MSTSEDQIAAVPVPARSGQPGASTARFARKKKAIVAAATDILNHEGVKGMTLAGVAARVGLITTSITYYFKKKEELAVACFLDGIERFDALLTAALHAPTPRSRLLRLLDLYLDLRRRIALGEAPPIAVFNDIRALHKLERDRVLGAYMRFFDKLRRLFDDPELAWLDDRSRTARALMLGEQMFWAVAWLPRYDVEDYDRIRDQAYDILVHGLATPGREWRAQALAIPELVEPAEIAPRETFLIAATRVINERGYRGASVEKISARLNVTKGSFYHHNEAKDDLVLQCFKRSFEAMRCVQRAVADHPGDHWSRLAAAASTLVDYQLSDRGPLLRTSALSALPESIRSEMVEGSDRVSDRFAGILAEGIASGSIRAVDPFIAAQMLTAALSASAESRWWIPDAPREAAAELHAKPLLMGIFS